MPPTKIMIVEDEVIFAKDLEGQLRAMGYDVSSYASTGEQAVRNALETRPDLVLMDIVLKGDLDGVKAAEQIRSELGVPIIYMTAYSDDRTLNRAKITEPYGFLVKPCSERDLRITIDFALYRSRVESERRRAQDALSEANMRLHAALEEVRCAQTRMVEQERLRAVGAMANGIAHRFNNMLTPILGFTELLLVDPEKNLQDTKRVITYLQRINGAAQEAASIVADLNEFCRTRDVEDEFTLIDLNKLLQETILSIRHRWADKKQDEGEVVSIEVEMGEIGPIMGNKAELRQMASNLMFNALDAMPRGGTLSIRTRPINDFVLLEVADTGSGMTPEIRQQCLEPFFTTKLFTQFGLGLSVVHGIVRRHSGAIDIQSTPGEGTKFIVRIPVANTARPVKVTANSAAGCNSQVVDRLEVTTQD